MHTYTYILYTIYVHLLYTHTYILYIFCMYISVYLHTTYYTLHTSHFYVGTIHSKQELRKMLALHVEHGAVDADSGNVLDGALTFRDMAVHEVVGG